MKRQIVNWIGVFGLLLVAACANAQNLKVTASVPFNFVADKATLPAGAYSIDGILAGGSKVLCIRNREAGLSRMMLVNSAASKDASPDTRLVFHRYGDDYFLAQIWVQGDSEGKSLPTTRREAEVARNIQRDENVIVLASLQ